MFEIAAGRLHQIGSRTGISTAVFIKKRQLARTFVIMNVREGCHIRIGYVSNLKYDGIYMSDIEIRRHFVITRAGLYKRAQLS